MAPIVAELEGKCVEYRSAAKQIPKASPPAILIQGGELLETLLAELLKLAKAKIAHPGGEEEDCGGHEEAAKTECYAHRDRTE